RPALPGFAAALADFVMNNAVLVFPTVLGHEGTLVENQGLPAVVPVQPQSEDRHYRHAGDAQAQQVVEFGSVDGDQMFAQQQPPGQIMQARPLGGTVTLVYRPVAQRGLPLRRRYLHLPQSAILAPMAQALPPAASRRGGFVGNGAVLLPDRILLHEQSLPPLPATGHV